ncbi:MAG TPA: nucleotidyltransferase family protein, partial [Candidatus Saccharimonadia bacterium]|nr:nucleotidyltransferase family protein [Candidatus Saccharimonadia bacterium]
RRAGPRGDRAQHRRAVAVPLPRRVTRGSHAALVLAAGGSRRLGEPKQLLRRDAETLVARAVRLAAGTDPVRLVVVVGAHRALIEAAIEGTPAEVLDNPAWATGLASSLDVAAAALAQHDGATLVLGCDQPGLEAAHLSQLLALAASATSGCAATVHDGQPGIPAVVTARVLALARGRAGDRGLSPMLAALPLGSVGVLESEALGFDIDEFADVEAAIARGVLDAR